MSDKEYNNCVDKYSDNVYSYLLRNLADSDTSKDLLQDSFLSLWSNRDRVEIAKAKSFLFTCAHNFMVNHWKYNKIRQNGVETPEFVTEKKFEQQDLIKHLISFLNKNMKECLILKDMQGFTYKEIAKKMNISEESVKINIFRARIKLKELITKTNNGQIAL